MEEQKPPAPVPDGSGKAATPGGMATPPPSATPGPVTNFSSCKQYKPQFSAATQMILNRMKGETASISPTLSKPVINPSTYEDVRRRVVAGMTTTSGMTMQMPALMPTPTPTIPLLPASRPGPLIKPTAGMSAIRRVTAGLVGKSRPKATTVDGKLAPGAAAMRKPKAASAVRAGNKRKRGKGQDGDDSSISSASDSEDKATSAPTTTKSGRQVTKPSTYNPAAMDSANKKRSHYGKRTSGEALCKKCTRLASPQFNQIVFCDGCDGAWHQLCHNPEIEDSVIGDPEAKWFCAGCAPKKEKHVVNKKVKVETNGWSGWTDSTTGQKRAYFSSLPHGELVSLLLYSVQLHPDLPIFPSDYGGSLALTTTPPVLAVPSVNGHLVETQRQTNGAAPPRKELTNGHTKVPCTPFDAEEEDPLGLMEAWPKPGHGLYHKLPPDEEDDLMTDCNDHEAFSHTVWDGKGNKVEENGKPLDSQFPLNPFNLRN